MITSELSDIKQFILKSVWAHRAVFLPYVVLVRVTQVTFFTWELGQHALHPPAGDSPTPEPLLWQWSEGSKWNHSERINPGVHTHNQTSADVPPARASQPGSPESAWQGVNTAGLVWGPSLLHRSVVR